MSMTRENLLQYLEERMGLDPSVLGNDTPLFTGGLLDSFSMVDVILFIESETESRMKATDVRLDNLDSIGRILAYADAISEDAEAGS